MDIVPDSSECDELYRLLTSIVAPRSIGWVSPLSSNGTDNTVPYSFS